MVAMMREMKENQQKESEENRTVLQRMLETMVRLDGDRTTMARNFEEEREAVRRLVEEKTGPSLISSAKGPVRFDDETRTDDTYVAHSEEKKPDEAKKEARKKRKAEKKRKKKEELSDLDDSSDSNSEGTKTDDSDSVDFDMMSSDSDSDDDNDGKKKKNSTTKDSHFPSLPDRDESQCTREEFEDFTDKVRMYCVCTGRWITGASKLHQACEGKTFQKEIALVHRRIMKKNKGKVHAKIKGLRRGARKKEKTKLYQAVSKTIVLQQIKVILKSTILTRDKARMVEEMQHLYMRECAEKINDVSVDTYMKYFLTHYSEQKEDPWTITALLTSLPAILRDRVKLRVEAERRTQSRIFSTLRELERDFTVADRQTYRNQLAAQGDIIDLLAIPKSSAKYKGHSRRPGNGKDKKVAFVADTGEAFYDTEEAPPSKTTRELKICFKCGHRHFGDKSPCPSGPKDEKAKKKAYDEFQKFQKDRKGGKTKSGYYSKSELTKWLEQLEDSRRAFRADNPDADYDDERNHMEAAKKDLGIGCTCREILDDIHDVDLDDSTGEAHTLRDLVQNVQGGSASIKHGLQKEGCLYDPVVLVNGHKARALSAVADGGADATYMGLDLAKNLAAEGLLIFVVQMKVPKKLNGISGQVDVRWYVGVYQDRGY